ncbi:MAG TPA: LTA synthase family protein [Verrucomicrobiae bacterium]|nr:LTA synthase family protein [Verrucomicrobiae bacterium]
MNQNPPVRAQQKSCSRYAFIVFCFFSLLAAFTILRVILFARFETEQVTLWNVLLAALSGFYRDIIAAVFLMLPLLFWCFLVGNRWFASLVHRLWFRLFMTLFWAVQIFLLAAEFFFFDEFKSRFNPVAVDYLVYPREVFINIWDAYPVPAVVGGCLFFGALWMWLAGRLFKTMWTKPVWIGTRFLWFAGALISFFGLSWTINLHPPQISDDRTLNEIANNGAVSFFAAAWTRNLDYPTFYKTLPREEAYARVQKMLSATNATFTGGPDDIRRKISGNPAKPKLNVVILLEESLGSEFWGSLGRKGETLTPQMDLLATNEGLLFDNIYASGNRTVRGMEGVLSGFPPLPGDAIVHRDRSENVETIARVLKRDGYHTMFLYGGHATFDNMKPYLDANGYDRIVDEKDFQNPSFANVWGVADEDLYRNSIQQLHVLSQTNEPFFATILSVSNHKPFTYPKGRIPENPNGKRNDAVKYTDWSLGQFFQAAKKEPFWTNTIFIVVADHGARVYGSQDIPIFSYEIPIVILGPSVVKKPERIHTLGGSLDVSPTILGLIGRPYESMFFGQDLLHEPADNARALLNHNRDIGVFANGRMVVLGLQKSVEFYEGDPKITTIEPNAQPSSDDLEAEKNAEAIFQVADELYMERRYHLDP